MAKTIEITSAKGKKEKLQARNDVQERAIKKAFKEFTEAQEKAKELEEENKSNKK
jgi:hypothetical protein